jgi:hypothetical protein
MNSRHCLIRRFGLDRPWLCLAASYGFTGRQASPVVDRPCRSSSGGALSSLMRLRPRTRVLRSWQRSRPQTSLPDSRRSRRARAIDMLRRPSPTSESSSSPVTPL